MEAFWIAYDCDATKSYKRRDHLIRINTHAPTHKHTHLYFWWGARNAFIPMIHENNDVISLLQHGRLLSTSIKLLHLYFSVFWPHNFFTAFNFFRFLIFSFTLLFFSVIFCTHSKNMNQSTNRIFFFFYRYFHYKVLHDSPTLFFIKNILCWVFLKFLSFSAYCKTHFLNLFYFLFFSFLFSFPFFSLLPLPWQILFWRWAVSHIASTSTPQYGCRALIKLTSLTMLINRRTQSEIKQYSLTPLAVEKNRIYFVSTRAFNRCDLEYGGFVCAGNSSFVRNVCCSIQPLPAFCQLITYEAVNKQWWLRSL